MITDEQRAALRSMRDQPGQDIGIIAACNAVLSGTASRETARRVLRTVLA